MRRREFLQLGSQGLLGLGAASLLFPLTTQARQTAAKRRRSDSGTRADVVVIGGGLGGCAAALAALRLGRGVILVEPTDWIGGQLTSQGVPPDEHPWIESFGCTRSYRALRDGVRAFYRQHYPLTSAARANPQLNPGSAWVSRLAHEPRVALAVLEQMLAPHLSSGRLRLLLEHVPHAAEVDGDRICSVEVRHLRTGVRLRLDAPFFIDASELGDLLPLAGVEHIVGAEARDATGEPHAAERACAANQQAFTTCFVLEHRAGEDHRLSRPHDYSFWRDYVPKLQPPWPGRLFSWTSTHPRTLEPRVTGFSPERDDVPVNLWTYRRIVHQANFEPGAYASDLCLVNWPQSDYLLGNLVGVSPAQARRHVERSKDLGRSLLYWLQTEAPRPDGGAGWPGLRFRSDVLGTSDGFAKHPYIREARRIRAVFTVLEQHIAREPRAARATGSRPRAERFFDSVGVGSYAVDLHPSTTGDNYVDFESVPFQIPLGALLPRRCENLIAGGKCIGTTHVTNGAYRLHPIEWNIGEAAGLLAAFVLERGGLPRQVRDDTLRLREFQSLLSSQGVELEWPESVG